MNRRSFVAGASALAALSRTSWAARSPSRFLMMVGTRTNEPGKGIYSFFFDAKAGTCTPAILAGDVLAPTAFALSPTHNILYSTSELGNDGKSNGNISALSVDKGSGKLSLIDKISASGGGPTYLALDRAGKFIVDACFGTGKVGSFQVKPDGSLGEMVSVMSDFGTGPTPRQTGPHAHCAVFSPGNRFVLAADLGADRVFLYRFDAATGKLTPNDPPFYQAPAGIGPRQVVFSPNGKFAYLMTEMGGKVIVFTWDENTGKLTEVQTVSCYPANTTDHLSGAGLRMRPDGRFVYTSTRTDNSLEVFAVDQANATLTLSQRITADGKTPWGIALDATGEHMVTANSNSNSASLYRVDAKTGNLSFITAVADIPNPVTAVFIPA